MSPAARTFLAVLAWLGALALPVVTRAEKLSDVVNQAKKPPPQQQVVGQQDLSQTKTKQTDAAPVQAPAQDAVVYGPFPDSVVLPIGSSVTFPYYTSFAPYGGGGGSDAGAPSEVRLRLGLVGGGGGLQTAALGGYGSGGLLVGFLTQGVSLDVRGYRSMASLSSDLGAAMRSFDGWAADVALRVHLFPDGSQPNMNLMFAARTGRYAWDYRNAVTFVSNGETHTLDHDSIGYRSVLAGLGVEPFRQGDWRVGFTVAGGVQFFRDTTSAGFDNDIFDDRGLLEVQGELVYSPVVKRAPGI
ncbi:MAG: hypothetical protein U0167_14345 [bacterium]